MLYAITLNYIRPLDEIKAQLEPHKQWLVKYIQAGTIIVAGPLGNEPGGFILAYGNDIAAIQNMISEDPFDIHKLVRFTIKCCDPAIRANNFPALWANDAKAIELKM